MKEEEIEVKFLNIDVAVIEKKLHSLGANKVFEKLYKRKVFDYPDLRLDKTNAWVRLRDESEKIMLSFKQRLGVSSGDGSSNDGSMKEIEIEVSDFNKMTSFLLEIGLIEKFYMENKRIRYILGDIEFDIDFWPQLEPYLEIEAPTWDKINEAIKILGLNPNDKKIFSTTQVYKLKGIDDKDYKEITFDGMIKRENKLC